MSYEDLKEHGIFLPEKEWGELDLATSVNLPALVVTFVVGIVSCVLMAIGGGHLWTWIGAGAFIIFIYAFALISNAGIDRQNRRVDEMHAEHETSSEPEL